MKPRFRMTIYMLVLFTAALAGCSSPEPPTTPAATEPLVPSETAVAAPPVDGSTPDAPLQPSDPPGAAWPDPAAAPTSSLGSLRVVYLKDGDIWLWTRSGGAVQLTNDGRARDVRLSGDGALIAYTYQVDNFHAEIWLVSAAGGLPQRLVSVDAFNAIAEGARDPNAVAINPYQFAWQPGTHLLAFNGYQAYDGPGMTMLNDLQVANADTLERWTLLEPGQGGAFTFSPDGGQIALVTPSEINLIDSNAGNWRLVLNYAQVLTYSEYRYYAEPVWSPDSASLRVAIPPSDPLAGPQPTILYSIPTDGAPARQTGNVFSVPFFDTPVSFSPDLGYLIYLAETGAPAENRRDLRIARDDGSGEWVYHNAPMLRFLGWSADSAHFVFVGGENQTAYLGDLGSPARPFTTQPAGIFEVHWIDGRTFIYLRETPAGYEISLGSLDGEDTRIDVTEGPPPILDFVP